MPKKKGKISFQDSEKGFSNNPFAALAQRDDLPTPAPEATKDDPQTTDNLDLSKARIHMNIEKKGRGGKTVTVIGGLADMPAQHRDELISTLKKGLGVGVTVEDDDIVVQGDQRPRLPQIFQKFGYPETR